ncbi:MAG: ABC transporter permease [Alphaproteobacteria bacterium]
MARGVKTTDVLPPLDRKVLRDLWRTRGQAIAIALVIACGIALYVLSNGMVRSLDETQRAYYERYRFADIFAPVVRAPLALVDEIAGLPGVATAEGRIAAGVLIDVPGLVEPVRGQVISRPDSGLSELNRVVLRQGRLPAPLREDEILLSEPFARAQGLRPGDTLAATMNGARRRLRIVGLGLSPEFIYTIAPGEFVPDDARFGVIWMGRRALEAAFDLDGAFNSVVVRLGPGASERAVIDGIDRILKRYGGTGAFPRDEQISHQFISSELDQLRVTGNILPPIFLAVAAFLLNIVVTRMVDLEREQIGLLRAFGYGTPVIVAHYAKYVMATAFLGGLLGCLIGVWLGRGMAGLYLQYFNFPFLIFQAGWDVVAIGLLVSLGAAALGIGFAVSRILALHPAVAMRPPIPMDYSHALAEPAWMKRTVDQPTRMILRRIVRQPVRALLTVLGIAAATGVLIVGRFSVDAVVALMDVNFTIADRQDMTVTFVDAREKRVVHDIASLPGVIRAEAFRSVPVRMINGVVRKRQGLTGLQDDPFLSRPIDSRYRKIILPERGVLLSSSLAESLGVGPGDPLRVEVLEGRQPTIVLPVTGIAEAFIGTPAYLRLDELNRVLGEGPRISGVYLQVDPIYLDPLYKRLKDMPQVAGVSRGQAARDSFELLLDQNLGTITFVNTLFAVLIAIGVVYNGARVALSERMRELASLRVLGFSQGETSYVLLGELGVLTVIGIAVGLGFGSYLAWSMVQSLETELYRIPYVISPATYGYAVLTVVIASLITGALVNRDVRRIHLVSALKTKE